MTDTHLGIDTGGTFTDFILVADGEVRIHKELSTPEAPEQAILRGMRALGVLGTPLTIVHGSTVATNAVLEGKGARTVFITNRGLGDLLTIGRQARAELYKLRGVASPPPVPRERCLETGGRLGASGELVDPLSAEDLQTLRAAVAALAPEAVAITLLFSYLDPRHERAIAAALPPGMFVSCSVDVLPEIREYERGIATWLNAYVGPLMQGYLQRLAVSVAPARLSIMQSSGLACAPHYAGERAVNLLLSGPAGGLQGARHLGTLTGCEHLLTFDMGGTSTDVAMIQGELSLTTEGRIGDYPVSVPMVDLHTIGAGGGSLAQVDAGGLLRVGPESAGARPGPACYGLGGTAPTVTDAHVVLGRLPSAARLAGSMSLDRSAATEAFAPLAAALGDIPLATAAQGVIDLVNTHMQQALRLISVARGGDPRGATLLSFGGAGGLHVCELADGLGMTRALVPATAGVLSALGMLATGPGRQLARSLRQPLLELDPDCLPTIFETLIAQGMEMLRADGVVADKVSVSRRIDLCYVGQSSTLSLPWEGIAATELAFHAAHVMRYGHRLGTPVQIVTARVRLQAPPPRFTLPPRRKGSAGVPCQWSTVHGITEKVAVWQREQLDVDATLRGPLIVIDPISTTWVAPDWMVTLDDIGSLVLSKPDCAARAESAKMRADLD